MFKNNINPVLVIGIIILSAGLPFFGIFLDEYIDRFNFDRMLKNPDQLVICSLWFSFFITGFFTLFKFKFMRIGLLLFAHLLIIAWLIFIFYMTSQRQMNTRDIYSIIIPFSVCLFSITIPGILLLSNVGIKASFGLKTHSDFNFYHNNFDIKILLGSFLLGAPLGILGIMIQSVLRFNESFKFGELLLLITCSILILTGVFILFRLPKYLSISSVLLCMAIFLWFIFMAEHNTSREVWGIRGFSFFGISIAAGIIVLLNNIFLKEQHEKHLNNKEEFDDILDT